MHRVALLLSFLLGAATTLPPEQPQPRYAEFPPLTGEQDVLILRVVDGDTVEFAFLVKRLGRIHGINARELKEPGGPEARNALAAMVPPMTIQRATLHGADKYHGRQLVNFTAQSGKPVSLELCGAGHARPWDGKGEKP